ncbi:MAG: Na/Pi cotransporter family protein [Bacteriovoracaceae bacterium]|nr:Na/Pi cotransporter family protein [Bacteriovoracaceae bacterium]
MNELIKLVQEQPLMTFTTGFALFFWGLRFLSQGIQHVFGRYVKEIISNLTEGRAKNYFAGLAVSQVVQSKGITAGMIFELANAGLVRLRRSMWLTAGANFATVPLLFMLTFVNPGILIMFIPVGIIPALVFTKSSLPKTGKILSGLGLLGMGLQLMNSANAELIPLLPSAGILSGILLFIIGTLFSMFVRSSLVALAPAMALISFTSPLALAWVCGVNLGSACLSCIRAKKANVFAKRVIYFHLMFNLIGVITLGLFGPLALSMEYASPSLLVWHILFNLSPIVTIFMFEKPIKDLLKKLVPDETINENFELRLLGKSKDLVPGLALAQTLIQIEKFKQIVDRMFALTKKYLEDAESKPKVLHKIKEYERITDNIRNEIVAYLGEIITNPLSRSQAKSVQTMLRVAFELEKIGDYLDKLAIYHTNLNQPITNQTIKNDFFDFFNEVEKFYFDVTDSLKGSLERPQKELMMRSREIREHAESMRLKNNEILVNEGVDGKKLQQYNDMLVALRKIRSHCQNIHLTLLSI